MIEKLEPKLIYYIVVLVGGGGALYANFVNIICNKSERCERNAFEERMTRERETIRGIPRVKFLDIVIL